MPAQKILAVRLSRDEMHARMFKATVYEIFRLGRVPKEEEINQVFLLSRVMYKAILGLHYKRQEQKKNGQLAIF